MQRKFADPAISGVIAKSTKWSQSVITMEMSKPGIRIQGFGRHPWMMKSVVDLRVDL